MAGWRCFLAAAVVCLIPSPALAEPDDDDRQAQERAMDALPKGLRALVPDGHEVLAWRQADLDRDGRPDLVFILQRTGSVPFDGDRGDAPRAMVVALADSRGRLRVVAHNDGIVRCQNCGGTWPEPFDELLAHRGGFTLSHYGGSRWRWSESWRFEFDARSGQWLLAAAEMGADTEDEGHQVRVYRRNQHFGRIRFDDFKGDIETRRWQHVAPPRPRRSDSR